MSTGDVDMAPAMLGSTPKAACSASREGLDCAGAESRVCTGKLCMFDLTVAWPKSSSMACGPAITHHVIGLSTDNPLDIVVPAYSLPRIPRIASHIRYPDPGSDHAAGARPLNAG